MALSLGLTGWWMYIDVPETPRAVVICVIVFNAAFGYSWGPIPWLYPPEVCIINPMVQSHPFTLSSTDHAVDRSCQGRVPVDRYKLGVQLPSRRNDSNPARVDRVEAVPDARLLLRLQFHPG